MALPVAADDETVRRPDAEFVFDEQEIDAELRSVPRPRFLRQLPFLRHDRADAFNHTVRSADQAQPVRGKHYVVERQSRAASQAAAKADAPPRPKQPQAEQ